MTQIQEKVFIGAVEDSIPTLTVDLRQQVLQGVNQVMDDRIAREVPAGWRNEERELSWVVSYLGVVRCKRRIYLDERDRRVKPVDKLLDLLRYARRSGRIQEMGVVLYRWDPYR